MVPHTVLVLRNELHWKVDIGTNPRLVDLFTGTIYLIPLNMRSA